MYIISILLIKSSFQERKKVESETAKRTFVFSVTRLKKLHYLTLHLSVHEIMRLDRLQCLKVRTQHTVCLGRPIMEENTALGASSPANPALHIPDPLSITNAAKSSSSIMKSF